MRLVTESRDVIGFAFLFYLAIRYAKSGDYESHKRLMLIAGLNLMSPAHARVPNVFDWPIFYAVVIALFFWIAIPIAYDKMSIGKVHRATKLGIAITVISFILVIAIAFSPLMAQIDMLIYGRITGMGG